MQTLSRILTIACMAAFSSAFAQKKTELPLVSLGGAQKGKVSVTAIVQDPVLQPQMPGCKVTEYTISFLPKGGDFFGPFRTVSNTLTPAHLAYLQKNKDVNVRIFIETIKCNCNGQDAISAPIILNTL